MSHSMLTGPNSSSQGVLSSAGTPPVPGVPLSNGHGASHQSNPRLRVQQTGRRTKRRHFSRAVGRVTSLLALDLVVLLAARESLHLLREFEWSAGTVATLFPPGFMGGWGSVGAVVAGLIFAGAYASEEAWASPPTVLRGIAIGTALGMWQSIDTMGALWTGARWLTVVAVVGSLVVIARYVLWRSVIRYRLIAQPNDRAILVGDPRSVAGRQAAEVIARRPGMHSIGWLAERGDIADYLGHPSAVWEILSEAGTDTVVLCGDLKPEMFETVVEAAAVAGCRVISIRPRKTMMASQPRALEASGLRFFELTFPAGRAGQDVIKRAFDIVVSLSLLILLSPVLALVSLWIKIDSKGPIMFLQDRVGRAGKNFRMWKFRSMSQGADAEKEKLAHLNTSGDPRLFKIPDDPRITRAGRVLRRWSLDEIPQLWNVLCGQMSLVGPRPFFEGDLAAYDDHHFIRLAVKPGVTGLWQVKGRSSIVDFEAVVRLDREYVEAWSLMLDMKILLSTLPAVMRRSGAY